MHGVTLAAPPLRALSCSVHSPTSRTTWIASYPKSGNTWVRLFLANLLFPERAPIDPNELFSFPPIASARREFDYYLGVPSGFLDPSETARLYPAAHRELARNWSFRPLLRKTHDAYTWLPDGRPMMGRSPAFAALYVVRDPCDVAVSAAHHWACDVDEAAARMVRTEYRLASRVRLHGAQVGHRLLSWSGHVTSWLRAPLALHVVRYEDLLHQPEATFGAMARFLGLSQDAAAVAAAVEACAFERLQDWEEGKRFHETPDGVGRFFRSGRSGEGRERLSRRWRTRLDAERRRVEGLLAEQWG